MFTVSLFFLLMQAFNKRQLHVCHVRVEIDSRWCVTFLLLDFPSESQEFALPDRDTLLETTVFT